MTMIADYPTKKALREAIAADPAAVQITDPAIMPEWRKFGTRFSLDHLEAGDEIVCTNHPKRSWFAQVKCLGGGRFKVL